MLVIQNKSFINQRLELSKITYVNQQGLLIWRQYNLQMIAMEDTPILANQSKQKGKIFKLIHVQPSEQSIHPLQMDRKRNLYRKLRNMNYVVQKLQQPNRILGIDNLQRITKSNAFLKQKTFFKSKSDVANWSVNRNSIYSDSNVQQINQKNHLLSPSNILKDRQCNSSFFRVAKRLLVTKKTIKAKQSSINLKSNLIIGQTNIVKYFNRTMQVGKKIRNL